MSSVERWRLGHRPALDGLRGIAVLAVFAYHGLVLIGGSAVTPAMGVVGVGVFFTLSGFLITSLLLDDSEQTGRVHFARFYRRRALRLFPAVAVLVLVELAVSTVVSGFTSWRSAVATLLYVQNWYTGLGGAPDALQHTWSLAIEEQFYLVWPVVVVALARFGWRALLAFALLGSAASILWRESLWGQVDAWRIYAGTDTRADGLLIGCALAIAMRQLTRQRSRTSLVAIGLVLLALTTRMSGYGYHVVAPLLTSIGTAAMLFGAAQGVGSRGLEAPWLRWVGQRSYGLYLWQVPVLVLLQRSEVNLWIAGPVYVAGSLLLTVVSWRYVETPFLRRKDQGSAWTSMTAAPTSSPLVCPPANMDIVPVPAPRFQAHL